MRTPSTGNAAPPDKRREPAETDPPRRVRGSTSPSVAGRPAPRLPHERDESSDSQRNSDGTATDVGKRAHDDVERGAVDTDRGPVTDRVYNDKVKR